MWPISRGNGRNCQNMVTPLTKEKRSRDIDRDNYIDGLLEGYGNDIDNYIDGLLERYGNVNVVVEFRVWP